MPGFAKTAYSPRLARRLGGCSLAVFLGGLAAALLLALAGGRPAQAAPAAIEVIPGQSIQAAIDAALPGQTILINAGHYTETLILSKAVSLTGVNSDTVIIHAMPGHRVLTATGALVDSSVVISGLSFTGGDETGLLGVAGGVWVGPGAQPRLENLRIYSNVSSFLGGGLYLNALPQTLVNVVVQSNTTGLLGGGMAALGSVRLTGGLFAGNSCTEDGCIGGGLWTDSASVTQTQFISNGSRAHGGGLFISSSVTLNGASLIRNTCTQTGCLGAGLFTSSTLTANSALFISNTSRLHGAGAHIVGDAIVNGGRFERNTCLEAGCYGGGLAAANLILTGTTLISNSSQSSGGGAQIGGWVRMSGGLFQANACLAASCTGGGLNAYGNGLYGETIVAIGTHFVNNHSTSSGGGAFSFSTANFTNGLFQENACLHPDCYVGGLSANDQLVVTNTNFISNTAGQGSGAAGSMVIGTIGGLVAGNRCTQAGCTGGAMGAYGANFSGTTFISNSAQVYGGAVSAAYLRVIGGLFERNACIADGCHGGALAGHVSLNIQGTQFMSNTARLGGGAAWSGERANVTGALFQGNTCSQAGCTGGGLGALLDGVRLSQTAFIQNTSRGDGGGAYVDGGTSVTGGQFAGNTCTDGGCSGGGLRANAGLVVTATAFLGNRATAYGGGLSHHLGEGNVVNALFARNSAGSGGAALYLASSGMVDILHTTIASPTVGSGAAIDVVNGTVQVIDTIVANYNVGIRRIGGGSVYEDYNLFDGVASTTVGPMTPGSGMNDIGGDPRFANPAGDDYHLRLGSAAIDSGADFAVKTDFDGDTRPQLGGFDVGYDEYVYQEQKLYLPMVVR